MPNVNEELTVGIEIEAVKLSDAAVEIINRRGFQRRYDRTIRGRNGEELPQSFELGGGSELITKPMSVKVTCTQEGGFMQIDYRSMPEIIKDLCLCVKDVNTSCGLHVHLGKPHKSSEVGPFGVKPSKWQPEQQRAWLGICAMLEDKFFALCPESRRNNRYCKPIRESFQEEDLVSFYPTGSVMPRKYDNPKRYCWLNLIETQRQGTSDLVGRGSGPSTGTVEIRMMGNVRRYNYIWAWIQLWTKIAAHFAYLSTSLVVNRLVVANAIAPEMAALAKIKAESAAKRVNSKTGIVQTIEDYSSDEAPLAPVIPLAADPDPTRFFDDLATLRNQP